MTSSAEDMPEDVLNRHRSNPIGVCTRVGRFRLGRSHLARSHLARSRLGRSRLGRSHLGEFLLRPWRVGCAQQQRHERVQRGLAQPPRERVEVDAHLIPLGPFPLRPVPLGPFPLRPFPLRPLPLRIVSHVGHAHLGHSH